MRYKPSRENLSYGGIRPSHLVAAPFDAFIRYYTVASGVIDGTAERMKGTGLNLSVLPFIAIGDSFRIAATAARVARAACTFPVERVEGLFLGR